MNCSITIQKIRRRARIKVIVYNSHMSFVRRGMLVFEGGGRDPISI